MARFDFLATTIDGVFQVRRRPIGDERGFLARLFCREEFSDAAGDFSIAQINHTLTRRKGAIRGMHFQYPPHAEKKLITCLKGEILDVAVDLRRESPTFLKWFATRLSPAQPISLLIPEGCAHGFQTLSDDCELLYLHSASYSAEAEGAVNAFDPRLGIDWPLPVTDISARDRGHDFIDDRFTGAAR